MTDDFHKYYLDLMEQIGTWSECIPQLFEEGYFCACSDLADPEKRKVIENFVEHCINGEESA